MRISDAIRSMREVCVLRHLSINTEKSYSHWLARYGQFLKAPNRNALTPEQKIETFLTRLAISGVAASTQNQAFNALLFFYREVLRQELGNVDALREGRVVLFPRCLAGPLDQQLILAKVLAAQDHASGIPVPLPGLLANKYPSAARSERWAWLFPSHTTCRDPRTGLQVRWRCHEANVQRAVKEAAHRCHLEGLTPHYLRHAYATHALKNGALVRDLQVVLGHASLETTMRHLHAEVSRVASPLQDYTSSPSPA